MPPPALVEINASDLTVLYGKLRFGPRLTPGFIILIRINGALAEARKDGTYDRLYKKYFGKRI